MENQIDPRIIRTRKLIMDAFIEMSTKKDFKDITIKDITTAATVNRATFYYHFIDKYDLLEKILSESIMREVIQDVSKHKIINEETVKEIFQSIIRFLTSISNQCQRSYEAFTPQIETIFKKELQAFFSDWAQKQWPNKSRTEVEVFSIILSWSLYGNAVHWMQNRSTQLEDYIKQLIHLINIE